MNDEEFNSFGEMLKHMIKISKMSQVAFYTQLGITKPYFYDIISGKVNPPPPKTQFKMVKILKLSGEQKKLFYEKAANERNELPADITYYIKENPDILELIRKNMDNSTRKGESYDIK